MFVRVRGGAVAVVLAWGLLLAGCGGDTSPVGTVKLFLKLSNNLNTEQQMHDLLAKQTCQRMKENALQASDHIGYTDGGSQSSRGGPSCAVPKKRACCVAGGEYSVA